MQDVFLMWLMGIAGFAMGYGFNERDVEPGKQAIELIKQCESELPRNQHCELIAVPVEKTND